MASRTILVVAHSRTGSTARLRDEVVAGIRDAADLVEPSVGDHQPGDAIEAVVRDATEATIDDVQVAGAVLFATPARFGALAGLTKDFLERIYPWFEEVPDVRPGMPWTAVVKGASDPSGAVRDLERILTGLRWRQVLPPLQCVGDLTDDHLAAARELGATLAAGIATDVW